MKTRMAMIALVCASGGAYAGFDADFSHIVGINNAIRIDNTGTGGTINDTFNAGQFMFEYTDVGGDRGLGQFSGGTFGTFCIELQQIVPGSVTYEITNVRNAPDPQPGLGGAYDAADEAEVEAVVAAAMRLGWLNGDLSNAGASNAQLAAIQGMIWSVVLDDAIVSAEVASVAAEMSVLQNEINNDPTATVASLRAMVNSASQDQLFIVPLPTAVYAGLFTLAGIGGVKRLRRR